MAHVDRGHLIEAALVMRSLGAKTMYFVGSDYGPDASPTLRLMSEGLEGKTSNPEPKVATAMSVDAVKPGYLGSASPAHVIKHAKSFPEGERIPLPDLRQGPSPCPNRFSWIDSRDSNCQAITPAIAEAINSIIPFGFDPKDSRKFPIAILKGSEGLEVTASNGFSFYSVQTEEPWALDRAIIGHRNIGKYTVTHIALETSDYEVVFPSYIIGTTRHPETTKAQTNKVTAVRFSFKGRSYMYRCLNEAVADFEGLRELFLSKLTDYGEMKIGSKGDTSCADWAKTLRKFNKRTQVLVNFVTHPEYPANDPRNSTVHLFSQENTEGPMMMEEATVAGVSLPTHDNFRTAIGFNATSLGAAFKSMQKVEDLRLRYGSISGQLTMSGTVGDQKHTFGLMPQMGVFGLKEFKAEIQRRGSE